MFSEPPVIAPTAAPAPTAPAPAAVAAASTQEQDVAGLIAELDSESEVTAASNDQPSPVQLYGFADIGYRALLVDDDNPWLLFLNRHPSFFVGNLNLYLDAQLSSRWRALFEVRFTYLPQGAPITDLQDDTIDRESSRTADYNDFSRSKALGSIIIERAQMEYSAFDFLSFKAGQWLTPYGVWNVYHGSPVIIGVSRPFIIGAGLVPEHQVGLMAEGSRALVGDFEVAYMIALSNGRIDSAPAYEDLDSNKAITARAALTYRGLGRLTLGSTFFTGRYAKAEYSPEPQSQEIGVADQIVIYSAGINVRPLPNVVFKTEYVYAYFPDGDPQSFAGSALHGLDFQLACSF